MASDQEMLERIAQLTNAIELQKSRARGGYMSTSRGRSEYRPAPYRPPYRPTAPTSYRGRGGNMTLSNTTPTVGPNMYHRPVYNPSNMYYRPPPPPMSSTAVISHNRSLVLNGKPSTPYPIIPAPTQQMKTKSQHRTLIINHKNSSSTSNTIVKSVDALTGRKQVAIDGVDFVVKGKKLIRKDLLDSNMTMSNSMLNAPKVLVRRSIKSSKRRDKNKNMVIGKAPILKRSNPVTRNKKGNMVFVRGPEGYVRQGRSGKSLVLNSHKKTMKKPRYCGFYTRFGKCPNAGRCPFVHDSNRRAICPRFLQNRCKKTGPNQCRLSHIPNPHIMPHCVHFQRGLCTNDPCIYMHVKVSKDAPVCKSFSMEGYCPKGLDCHEKHVHVCPEFADTGKCTNANCRLPHVARRTANTKQTGIIRLGSWVSPQYFHKQKMAKTEKRKAIEDAAAAKVWTRPSLLQEQQETQDLPANKEDVREAEEQEGYIRLFNDSDDDEGWSQFERNSEVGDEEIQSLRFNEEEEDEEEDEEEANDEEEESIDENEQVESIQENEEDRHIDDSDDDSEGEFQDAEEYPELNMEENETGNSDEDQSDEEEVYEEISDTEMSDG